MKIRVHIPLLLSPLLILMISGCQTTSTNAAKPNLPPEKVVQAPAVIYYGTLSDLTDSFANDLARDVGSSRVFLDSTAIREMGTKDVSNLSAHLQNELESSFSKKGFNMVYSPDEADYLIGAVYKKDRENVLVYLKYRTADFTGSKTLNYNIKKASLPSDSFDESIRSRAYRLAANILSGQNNLKLYITPIKEGNRKYTSDFSNSFTSRLKVEMSRLRRNIEIIDEKPIYETLSKTRGLGPNVKIRALKTAEAQFCGADTVFEGEYFIMPSTVTINCYLKDLNGRILSSSSIDIDRNMIPDRLNNQEAEKISELVDTVSEQGDFNVRISTTKGGDSPVYYRGENIKFHMQVASPLYVYLYDINSKNEVTLLYPYKRNMMQQKLKSGELYKIPADTDKFDFKVVPPYGIDGIKIFASDKELPIPQFSTDVPSRSFRGDAREEDKNRRGIQVVLANKLKINPKDLVDYYRGVAKKHGANLFEDSLIIETKEQ